MKHEIIHKTENGYSYKVEASLYVDFMRDEFYWSASVSFKGKGKKKFEAITEGSENVKGIVERAKFELWQKIKP